MDKKMKNIKNILLVALVLSIGTIIVSTVGVSAYEPSELYDTVWKLVNKKYVDPTNNHQDWEKWRYRYQGKIKTNEDAYVAIDTMLASLNDPYTKFLDPKEFAEETTSMKGSLKGIGIQIGLKDGKLTVIAPIENSPAEKAGILADDEIIEINGESTKGISIDKAADKIRGAKGTVVKLTIKRKNSELKHFEVVRDEIEIKAVSTKVPEYVKMPADIQYIRLSSFISKNASKEFVDVLMKSQNKKGIIVDLRSNPGGLFTNAVYIANMLLKNGVIVSTVDRDGYKDTTRSTPEFISDKPMVVLIDKGSASASEILSGALKDNKRAVIVGEQSFGKGLVQEVDKLPEGAGLNITILKYLTPNGTDIHKKGITPDIVVKFTEEDIKNKKDVQMEKAIEVLQSMDTRCKK